MSHLVSLIAITLATFYSPVVFDQRFTARSEGCKSLPNSLPHVRAMVLNLHILMYSSKSGPEGGMVLDY